VIADESHGGAYERCSAQCSGRLLMSDLRPNWPGRPSYERATPVEAEFQRTHPRNLQHRPADKLSSPS
jgi:hypothetical protein